MRAYVCTKGMLLCSVLGGLQKKVAGYLYPNTLIGCLAYVHLVVVLKTIQRIEYSMWARHTYIADVDVQLEGYKD